MEVIVEVFPFVFGVLLGMMCSRLDGRRRTGLWLIGSLALGALATFATGEYRASPAYFLFDIGLVAVVSVATVLFVQRLRGRHGRGQPE